MTPLPFSLDREVLICATRPLVFRYFTDSARFAAWWGVGSSIDARPGGEVLIRYPNGLGAQGQVLEVAAPERIVFTYGYDRPGSPIPPGGSRVTVTLLEEPGGTRVRLRHELADAAVRDQHRAGWRYQLAVFAAVASDEQQAGAAQVVDGWFAAWSVTDGAARRAALAAVCAEGVVYRDRFGNCTGLEDLDAHLAASQQHLPARLEREGAVRQAAGMALVDWVARRQAGEAPAARGTSVFELTPGGQVSRVTGFWRE